MTQETIETEHVEVGVADMEKRSWEEASDRRHGYTNSRHQATDWSDWESLRNIDLSLRRMADALEMMALSDGANVAQGRFVGKRWVQA